MVLWQVIEAVLEMFETQRTNDQFWHGACLALGELARRGLLLPERLESVVPLVQQALGFDQRPERAQCELPLLSFSASANWCNQ